MTRRTYHYDEASGEMVEGRGPSRTEGSGDGWRFSDRVYSASPFVAHDGTVIDSRKKHRDYMKRNNLSTVDDYTNQWESQRVEREKVFTGKHDREGRANDIAAAIRRSRDGD